MTQVIDVACPDLLTNAWFLDDGNLIGATNSVLHAVHLLESRGPEFGLILNPAKCELWWPSLSMNVRNSFPPTICQVYGDGISLLGGPVGGPVITRHMWNSRLDKIASTCLELDALNNSQVQLALLRSCAGFPKINFALRTCNPMFLDEGLNAFDAIMQKSLTSITNCEVSGHSVQQSRLPISLGGLGIPSALELSSAAFLSSLFQSVTLQKSMIRDDVVNVPRSCSAVLMDSFNQHFPNDVPISATSLVDAPHSQKLLSDRINTHINQALLQNLAPADLARLKSVSGSHASDWLNVVPMASQGLTMTNREYSAAIRVHLGLRNVSEVHQCDICHVLPMDYQGYHALSCSSGGMRIHRHNAICDILFHNMRAAFLTPQLEVTGLFADNRRADLVVPLWQGKKCAFDVTIPSPVCASNISLASNNPLLFLESRVQNKTEKYSRDLATTGLSFKALVIDAFGHMHSDFIEVVKEVAKRRANVLGEEDRVGEEISFLFQRISFTLRRAIACSIVERAL